MAVKPLTLTICLHHHHIAIIRPTVNCKLPHQPIVSCSAFHQDCSHRKQEDHSSEVSSTVRRWRDIKSSIKVRASQVYSQVTYAKELGKTLSWNVPSMTTSSGPRITVVQPLAQATKGDDVPGTNKNLDRALPQAMPDMKGHERKPRKRVILKPSVPTELKVAAVGGQTGSEISANAVREQLNNDSGHQSVNGKDESKIKEKALLVLQTEEVVQAEPVSRFKYGIFDVDSLLKRIQEQFTLLESLTKSKTPESESNALVGNEEEKTLHTPNLFKYSEEFETGNQSDVYGDVIIQFRPKSDKVEDKLEASYDPSVSTIFRDNLDEWDQRHKSDIVKAADSQGDISKEVSSSFLREVGGKVDMPSLLNQILFLKSVSSITEFVQGFNKKFIKEQAQPVDGKLSASELDRDIVDGFYFDTNAPLIDMTQVIGEMEQLKHPGKTKETLNTIDGVGKDDKASKDEVQEMRRSRVQISQTSVKSRMKSLTVAVGKPSTTASSLLKLQRFCRHLSEYPDTRDIAVQENLIPILLRRRDQCDDANQAEIRRALSLMGYADPVKEKESEFYQSMEGDQMVPIQILKTLEESCQQRIGDMFDFVIGVSSGAVTAFLLAIAKATVEDCEQLYKELSSTVFGRNRFLGTSNLVLNHAFYDTEGWIKMLREHFQGMGNLNISETARDPTCPKVAAVATLMNVGTLRDYLFRNYNLPPGSVSFYQGSSKYRLWEALRASSAAPGYFEEFKLDDHVFQDGGVLTNNPCALAVHECRLLWPDTPIQCVVSVGTGRYDPMDQEFPAEYSSLKTKLFKVLCSATDTEAVHIILKDLLPAGKYFRFNPIMSEDFLLDESKPEKLEKMQTDTREYLARNELKLMQASGVLTREKSRIDKVGDWITLQKKMRIPRRKVSYWRD